MPAKTIKSNQNKCATCGGILKFSPKDRALKCESCGGIEKIDIKKEFDKHYFDEDVKKSKEYNEFKKTNKVFKCSSCGSNVILNSLEISKLCPYCSSPCVIDPKEDIGLKPDGIIPFKFGRKEASELYKKGIKKKWFLPNKFKKKPPIDEMKGVYVPSFSFDANASTTYYGKLGDTKTDSKGRTHTTYRTISGKFNSQHHDVLVESSSKINQKTFNSINPYNMKEVVSFNSNFILGYSLEHYNQNLAECKIIADEIMKNKIKTLILSNYNYDVVAEFSQNTIFSEEKFAYFILPIYQVNYKYKDKNYTTFMNGQTGKVGSGYPKSAVKITFFILFIFLIFFGFVALFYLT